MNVTGRVSLMLLGTIILSCIGFQVLAETQEGGQEVTVTAGKEVSIEYTLTLDDKSVVDSNVGGQPFSYVQGNQQVIPGLEKAMEGLKVGDTKQITVSPAEGYGEVHEEAFLEVNKDKLPPEAWHEGAQIQGTAPDGQPLRGQVKEVKEETVVLDFNHPLAGKTLHFDVKVLDIK